MALVICPDCNKTRIPTREQIIDKDYCRCFAELENFGMLDKIPSMVIKERIPDFNDDMERLAVFGPDELKHDWVLSFFGDEYQTYRCTKCSSERREKDGEVIGYCLGRQTLFTKWDEPEPSCSSIPSGVFITEHIPETPIDPVAIRDFEELTKQQLDSGQFGKVGVIGTVTCKHSGVFSNEERSLRFEPASNGEADKCDIVVFDSEGDIRRYDNLIMECLHEGTKVYSGEFFASIPPRWGWICTCCGEMGSDDLGDYKPQIDPRKFRELWKLYGHGE